MSSSAWRVYHPQHQRMRHVITSTSTHIIARRREVRYMARYFDYYRYAAILRRYAATRAMLRVAALLRYDERGALMIAMLRCFMPPAMPLCYARLRLPPR